MAGAGGEGLPARLRGQSRRVSCRGRDSFMQVTAWSWAASGFVALASVFPCVKRGDGGLKLAKPIWRLRVEVS